MQNSAIPIQEKFYMAWELRANPAPGQMEHRWLGYFIAKSSIGAEKYIRAGALLEKEDAEVIAAKVSMKIYNALPRDQERKAES